MVLKFHLSISVFFSEGVMLKIAVYVECILESFQFLVSVTQDILSNFLFFENSSTDVILYQ